MSPLRQLIRTRITNASGDSIRSKDPSYKGLVSAGGSIAYALLEVADAIKEHNHEDYDRLMGDVRRLFVVLDDGDVEEVRNHAARMRNVHPIDPYSQIDQRYGAF